MKKKGMPYLMVAPALLLMIFVVVYPIINTISRSFHTKEGALTIENYHYFFTSMEAFQSLVFTIQASIITTFLATLFSLLLALYLRFSNSAISRFLGHLYLIPRFIPGIVAVYAVMNVIKNGGLLGRMAMLFGINYKPGVLYDIKGIVISNLWFTIPFSAMLLSSALSNVEDSYIESAKSIGCTSWQTFQTIIFPLIFKDIVISATFILMGQIGSFTIPYLTGPNNPKMLGILLYQQSATYMDYEKASALSVLIFLLCLFGTLVYIKVNLKESKWQK